MKRRSILRGLVFCGLAALAVLAVLAALGVTPADLRRETRLALGLPKFWQTNFVEDVTSKRAVACPTGDPLVIVTGGQSHAANALGRLLPYEPSADNVMVYRSRCYAVANPVLGATGVAESLWTRFGARLVVETGRPVVFINGAVAGSQVTDWLDDRSGYRDRLVATIREARQLGYEPDVVLWIQGETDAAAGVDPDEFATGIARISTAIESESGMTGSAQWLLFRSTFCDTLPENGPRLEAALTRLTADPDDRLHLGPSVTRFARSLRHDGCHLNGEGGALLIEDMLAALNRIGVIDRQGSGQTR